MIIYLVFYSFFLFIKKYIERNFSWELSLNLFASLNGFFSAYLLLKIVIFLDWNNFVLTGLILLTGTIFASFYEKKVEEKQLLKSCTYSIYELLIIFMVISPIKNNIFNSFIYGISLYLCTSHILPEKISNNALIYTCICGILGFFVGIVILF